jgi:hypothetical protein
MNDFAAFQLCYSGVGHPYPPVQCHCFDRNNDGDIDQDDFVSFTPCATRAGVPANPACGG